MMRSQRFQQRIILIVLLFGSAMIFLNHWRTQVWLRERRLERLEREAGDTASRLSGLLQHLTRRQLERAAELEMSYVALSPHVDLGVVCDAQGRIAYSSRARLRGLDLELAGITGAKPLLGQAFESMNSLKEWDRNAEGTFLTVVAPFYESFDADSKSAVVIRYDATSAASQSHTEATRESVRQALVLVALCLLLLFSLEVLIVQLRQAENLVLEIAEQERRKIGGNLHDDLCQRLSATKLKAEVLHGLMDERGSKAAALSEQMAEELADSVLIARGMAHGLSPVALERMGLGDALQGMAVLMSRTYNVECAVECEDVRGCLSVGSLELVFRIAQELAVNACKHSAPSALEIEVKSAGRDVVLKVAHDGAPFHEPKGNEPRGMGLYLISQRVRTLEASLERDVERRGEREFQAATLRVPVRNT